jgi:hypothetical protein
MTLLVVVVALLLMAGGCWLGWQGRALEVGWCWHWAWGLADPVGPGYWWRRRLGFLRVRWRRL